MIYSFSILFNPYISSSFNINLNIDNPIEKISFFSGINYPISYPKYFANVFLLNLDSPKSDNFIIILQFINQNILRLTIHMLYFFLF